MKLYIGCTLGPIFQVINKARKPLEIWMASYLFSHVAKDLVAALADAGAEFVSPSPEGIRIAGEVRGAGLYSDHFFFSIKKETAEDAKRLLDACMDKALDALVGDMAQVLGADKGFDERACRDAVRNTVFLLSTIKQAQDDETIPMHTMTAELDALELYPPYVARYESGEADYFLRYLDAEKLLRSAWVNDEEVNIQPFAELAKGGAEAPGDRQTAKYMAIVQADGDKIGSLLRALSVASNVEGVRGVSKRLFEQGKKNVKAVKRYGALPIYFGGDDMLFIAPLFGRDGNGGERSLFALLAALSDDFQAAFEQEPAVVETGIMPSLSFGVSICYIKYPLRLARESAVGALFAEAKTAVWPNGKAKKAFSIHLRKHSGQESRLLLSDWQGEDAQVQSAYRRFCDLATQKVSEITVRALHWKIIDQFDVLYYLLTRLQGEERITRQEAWFAHNFNEWAEEAEASDRLAGDAKDGKTQAREKTIRQIIDFLCAVADDAAISGAQDEQRKSVTRNNIDGMFRLDEFLHSKTGEGGEGGNAE